MSDVLRQFGSVAANYATSAVFAAGADLKMLVEVAAPSREDRALDLGTAAGHAALALAPHVREVVGVDLVPQMIDQARFLAADRGVQNVVFQTGDVENLDFETATFDLVVTRFSTHHWPNPGRAFEEVARVLRPGGQFIAIDTIGPLAPEVDDFILEFERLRDPSHLRSLSLPEWQRQLADAGFNPTVERQWDMDLDFDDWTDRMQTPPDSVATLRQMMAGATGPIREVYKFRERNGRQTFVEPCALILAPRSTAH